MASVFGASVVAQVVLKKASTTLRRSTPAARSWSPACCSSCGACRHSRSPLIILAAITAGVGQGLSFSKGLAAVLAKVDPHERAGVTSAFFVVAYIAISVPVIGEGMAAQHWGLTSAGTSFSAGVARCSRRWPSSPS